MTPVPVPVPILLIHFILCCSYSVAWGAGSFNRSNDSHIYSLFLDHEEDPFFSYPHTIILHNYFSYVSLE